MTNDRKTLLLGFKKELEKQPFKKGCRQTVIGSMSTVFEHCKNEDEVFAGMQELGENLKELGMCLCSFPKHPEILCAGQFTDAVTDEIRNNFSCEG